MELWMIIVGISMACGRFPQIYRIWRRETGGDISITLWIVLIHGLAWWLVYGIINKSTSLIITNSICIVLDSIILIMVIKYKNKNKIGEKNGAITNNGTANQV